MNDKILLTLPKKEFQAIIDEGFQLCRESYGKGHMLALTQSPLAYTSLVTSCLTNGETTNLDARGRTLRGILHWAVEKLRPPGKHSWDDPAWRSYNVLFYPYLDGNKTVTQLAHDNKMNLDQAALEEWYRTKAIPAVARIFYQELTQGQEQDLRHQYVIRERYKQLAPNVQAILRLAAIFQNEIPLKMWREVALQVGITKVRDSIAFLFARHFLEGSPEDETTILHPNTHTYLLGLISPQEAKRWHLAVGTYYQGNLHDFHAIYHFRQAGEYDSAAKLLVEHFHTPLDHHTLTEVWTILGQFGREELSVSLRADIWPRLKLISGQVAELMGETTIALSDYGQAIQAANTGTSAMAYYRRANLLDKLNQQGNALRQYNQGIELLQREDSTNPLLVRMLISRAWFFIHSRSDLVRAEADLNTSLALIDAQDTETWLYLHNTTAALYLRKGHIEYENHHRLRAWLAANELKNATNMINSAYNLGRRYVEQGSYQAGIDYLKQSKDLAEQAQNMALFGLNCNFLGIAYLNLQDFEEALSYYQQANQTFINLGNEPLLVQTYLGLVQVYSKLGRIKEAQTAYKTGWHLAQKLNLQQLLNQFSQLSEQNSDLPDLKKIQATTLQKLPEVAPETGDEMIAEINVETTIETVVAEATTVTTTTKEVVTTTSETPLTDDEAQSDEEEEDDDEGLTDHEQLILDYVKKEGQIASKDYQNIADVSSNTASRHLSDMVDKGWLIRKGRGRATHYILAT